MWLMTGEYVTSRGPGYFLTEAITAILLPLGLPAFCAFNSALFAVSVVLFAATLRIGQIPYRSAIIWGYALLPLSWVVSSGAVIEHCLWVCFSLASVLATLRAKYTQAGLWYGLAIATRPSHGIPVLLAYALYWYRERKWGALFPVAIALIVGIALWVLPIVILMKDMQVLFAHLPNPLIRSQTIEALIGYLRKFYVESAPHLGIVPMTLLVVIFLAGLKRLFDISKSDKLVFFFAIKSLIIFALFLYGPYKSHYIFLGIPAMLATIFSTHLVNLSKAFLAVSLAHGVIALPVSVLDKHTMTYSHLHIPRTGALWAEYSARRYWDRSMHRLLEVIPRDSMVFAGLRVTAHISFLLREQHQYRKPQLVGIQFKNIHLSYLPEKNSWIVSTDFLTKNNLEEILAIELRKFFV